VRNDDTHHFSRGCDKHDWCNQRAAWKRSSYIVGIDEWRKQAVQVLKAHSAVKLSACSGKRGTNGCRIFHLQCTCFGSSQLHPKIPTAFLFAFTLYMRSLLRACGI
jgi:hypothetical protein